MEVFAYEPSLQAHMENILLNRVYDKVTHAFRSWFILALQQIHNKNPTIKKWHNACLLLSNKSKRRVHSYSV